MGSFRPRPASISLRLAVAAAACALGVTAAASMAFAAPGGDPSGANGTVKIGALEFDSRIANEPHVTCEFRVKFFNFDKGERANIVFRVHPPTGSGIDLLRLDDELVSNDAADGGAPDPDETFTFSASQLGLDAYTAQANQGYHVKLTVERIGAPGAGKHKVFWIQPCVSPTTTGPSGSEGAPGEGGGLPVTGAPVIGLVAAGAAMVAAGVALVVIRRRRDLIDLGEG